VRELGARGPAAPAEEGTVLAAYVAVTVGSAGAYAYAAFLNFTHDKSVAAVAERLHVPVSWQVWLGFPLAAGSLGLVAGFVVPALGTAAACGLVLYFLCAAGAHIRARDTQLLAWVNWAAFFSLAIAALVVGLALRFNVR
jgi:DoxX-like family